MYKVGHKKFFKRRNLFLVSFLAVAGIFSATAIVKNQQTFSKADATESYVKVYQEPGAGDYATLTYDSTSTYWRGTYNLSAGFKFKVYGSSGKWAGANVSDAALSPTYFSGSWNQPIEINSGKGGYYYFKINDNSIATWGDPSNIWYNGYSYIYNVSAPGLIGKINNVTYTKSSPTSIFTWNSTTKKWTTTIKLRENDLVKVYSTRNGDDRYASYNSNLSSTYFGTGDVSASEKNYIKIKKTGKYTFSLGYEIFDESNPHDDTFKSGSTSTISFANITTNVTFDRQSGTGGTGSATVTYGSNMATITPPTRDGFDFYGYYTSTGGSGTKYYNADGSYAKAWDILDDTKTLYAYWQAAVSKFTVTINDDSSGYGSVDVSSIPNVLDGTAYSVNGKVLTIGTTDVTAEPETKTTQYEYSFTKWTLSGSETALTSGIITANTTIVAHFSRSTRSYTVTFSKNGKTTTSFPTNQTVQYGGKVTTPSTPAANGYDFGGWYKENKCTNAWNFSTDTISGATTIYAKWTEYTDFTVKIDGTSYNLSTHVNPVSSELYQLSMSSGVTVHGGETIEIYKGATKYTSSQITIGDSTNISVSGDVWSVRNFTYNSNIYLRVLSNGKYELYMDTYSSHIYGVESGDTFYIEDKMNLNGYNAGSPTYKIAVYFYGTVGESSGATAWAYPEGGSSKGFATLDTTTYTSSYALYKVTAPTYEGRSVKWTSFNLLKFGSDVTTENISHDTAWKKSGTTNVYDGAKRENVFTSHIHNGIELVGWDDETYWDYDVQCNATMYVDGGPESEEGIYIDISGLTADSGWSFTSGYGIYVYFFYEVRGSSTAQAFSSQATLVPGETTIYETEVPKLSSNKVQWGKVIVLNNNTPAFRTGDDKDKYQTQDIWFNKSMHDGGYQTIYFSNYKEGLKQHAEASTTYTDAVRANYWGSRFIGSSGVTCDNGETPPWASKWTGMKSEYNPMSSAAKELVKTAVASESGTDLQKAVARYDYIIHKYGTDPYTDYANRTDKDNGGAYSYGTITTYKPYELIMGSSEDNLSVIVIVIASSVSLLSITALSILMVKKRKRKEQ